MESLGQVTLDGEGSEGERGMTGRRVSQSQREAHKVG